MNEEHQKQDRDYTNMVDLLSKPGEAILRSLTPEKCHLWHMATGIATEAGELLDAVKRHVIYEKELDLANVNEELGDLEFYLEGIRQAKLVLLDRFAIRADNMAKLLKKRYPDGVYTDHHANQRLDKESETT